MLSTLICSQIKIHNNLSVNKGLVHSQITSIFQDSKGYLWIGTLGGLSKWDGINFTNYHTHDGLPASQIMDIEETSDGSIFLAAYGGGVLKIKDGVYDTLDHTDGLVNDNVAQIVALKNDNLLFLGNGGSISLYSNGNITDWGSNVGFPSFDIWDATLSNNDILYCATQKGLVIVQNDSVKIMQSEDGLLADLVWSVNTRDDKTVYVGTTRGVNKIINGKITTLQFNGKPISSAAYKILYEDDGTVYFATNRGVFIANKKKVSLLTKENGLVSDDNWTLTKGDNGLLFFGTNGNGVSIYDPNESIINIHGDDLADEKTISIVGDDNGNVYLGSKLGLTVINNYRVKSVFKTGDMRGNNIDEIFRTSSGKILLGTKSGLKIFSNNEIKNFINNDSIINNEIFTITENDSGKLYLGTRFGVFTIFDKKVEKVSYFESISSNFIMSILASQDQKIYFGSFDKGLFIEENENYRQFSTKNGLSDNFVNCLFEDKGGTIWVGTNNGINLIKGSFVVDTIDIRDGLTSNIIADINEDSHGNIYISSFKGINVLNKNNRSSDYIRTINSSDGLIYDNCIKGASYIDFNDKLWIGTSKGISIYNAVKDRPNIIPPKIYITGIEIFNEKYSIEKLRLSAELEYDQNYLKFIFTGINLSAPEKILYKYRLSNVDQGWVTSNSNNVQYTSLENGNYIFEVSAMNEWGYWSEPASLSFTINPAWWETWWFQLLVISSIGFILWAAFQYRLNYLLKLERLRTKIASDLHDEVGSALTQISINADSLSYIKDIEKINMKSGFIRSKSNEVINMMSDVIWSIDSRNDNLESLIDRIHNFAQKFLDQTNINLNFNTDIPSDLKKSLKIDFRQNVMMIAKEAINNAVKYSGCSKIDISITFSNGKFDMEISDNGKGIDFEKVKYGNGLKNMKSRAESVKGQLELDNNNGLTIHFTKLKI